MQSQVETKSRIEPLMSLKELQEYLPGHPHESTIWRWRKAGKLRVYRIGRRLGFRKSQVDKALMPKSYNSPTKQDNEVDENVK